MLNNPANPLIHVGLHKTASTYLQEFLFDNQEAEFCAPWGKISHTAIGEFVSIDPVSFDKKKARSVFQEGLKIAQERQLIPVLTHIDNIFGQVEDILLSNF